MCGVGVIFCHRNALVCYTCMAFINVVIMGQPIVYATQSNYCENMRFLRHERLHAWPIRSPPYPNVVHFELSRLWHVVKWMAQFAIQTREGWNQIKYAFIAAMAVWTGMNEAHLDSWCVCFGIIDVKRHHNKITNSTMCQVASLPHTDIASFFPISWEFLFVTWISRKWVFPLSTCL